MLNSETGVSTIEVDPMLRRPFAVTVSADPIEQ